MRKFGAPLFLLLLVLPVIINAQNISVTFRVNMSYLISQSRFNPASEFVDVAGSFNGWGATSAVLSDTDGDQIYEIVLGGFTSGSAIDFKFRINGQWAGREEFPGGGPNRSYTVKPGSNVIEVWYNNEISPLGPPKADFASNTQRLFENGIVQFSDRSAGEITKYQWSFEGGSPESSTEKNPSVFYQKAGNYSVRLIVSNNSGSDTIIRPGLIQVQKRDSKATYWWNNSVFYEIFVRSFYDSNADGIGDFKGLISKLDYLNDGDPNTQGDLGVTGIWLMPINASPSEHGYDVTNYYTVNPSYGTMNDFREFLTQAHKRGIRVIIDYVMNHTSNQHYWFQQSALNNPKYRNFYRWSPTYPGYQGPMGEAWHQSSSGYYYGVFWSGMPDLNYEEPAVKDSMMAVADYWLKDVGVDGFRLDAVLYLIENGTQMMNTDATLKFWGEFGQHIRQTKADAFTVGEAWTNTETALNYATNNRLDYCFEFDLAASALNGLNSGDAANLVAQMQKVHNLYPFLQYGTFLTNHDQNRVMSVFQNNINKAKAAASLYLTFPGIPYIYYGEEIGMTGSTSNGYNRTPMQWANQPGAGFTTGTPWLRVNSDYPTSNVTTEQASSSSLLNWYKKLISIRSEQPALRLGDYEGLLSSASPVVAFFRHYQGKSVLVVVNTSANSLSNLTLSLLGNTIAPSTYSIKDLISGKDSLAMTVSNSHEIKNISLDGYQSKIYSFTNGSNTDVETKAEVVSDFYMQQNYPNPFNPVTNITYSIPVQSNVELKIFDMLGREVMTLVNEEQASGKYSVKFDGVSIPSGVYIYTIKAGQFRDSKKLVLLK